MRTSRKSKENRLFPQKDVILGIIQYLEQSSSLAQNSKDLELVLEVNDGRVLEGSVEER